MIITVRGEVIEVTNYVANKIPYLQALNDTIGDTKECIAINSIVSPRFLKIVIEYFTNDQLSDDLKKILREEFEEDVIKCNLLYLGLNDIYDLFYVFKPNRYFKGKLVIDDIVTAIDHYGGIETCGVLPDGSLVSIGSLRTEENRFGSTITSIKKQFINMHDTIIRVDSNEIDYILNEYRPPVGGLVVGSTNKYSVISDEIYEINNHYYIDFDTYTAGRFKHNTMLRMFIDEAVPRKKYPTIEENKQIREPYVSNKNNSTQSTKLIVLKIRGKEFNVPEYIVESIPNISKMYSSTVCSIGNGKEIEYDTIPPVFFDILINCIKNDQKPGYMKQQFKKQFSDQQIKKYLKILEMQELINKIFEYSSVGIIDKLVIINGFVDNKLILSNGQTKVIKFTDDAHNYLSRTYIRVIGEEIIKNDMLYIKCFPGSKDMYLIPYELYVIELEGMYFIHSDIYSQPFPNNEWFSHGEFIKNNKDRAIDLSVAV